MNTMPAVAISSDHFVLLGRIDGKIDIIVTQQMDHNQRIAVLEAWRNRVVGLIIGCGVAGGVAGGGLAGMLSSQAHTLVSFLLH